MKKINLFLTILAAAAGFTNCAKVDLVENKEAGNGGTVVYATTDAVTKTTLASDYKVLWSTGDQIKFVKDDTPATTYTFTLSEGGGTTSGTFTGDTPADGEYTVYYPATYDGSNWPAQTYVSATDISGALMKATATVSGGSIPDLTFTNEGGILRYTVKGSKTIKSINVKSGSTLDVTLDCGTSGVALTAEGTVFNIALPAGEYSNATLTFTATDNTHATKMASSFKVTKNVVSLATFEASALSFVAPPPEGFVDLGVVVNSKPLFWAKCNLGASKPEEYGTYFSWGETGVGRSATTSGSGAFSTKFNWDNDAFGQNFEKVPMTTACPGSVLALAYDAAYQKNNSWRMPTKEDFMELFKQCFAEWTADYDGTKVQGLIVWKAKGEDAGWFKPSTAGKGRQIKTDGTYNTAEDHTFSNVYAIASDAHIFFPAAGFGDGDTFNKGSYPFTGGYYWSTTLRTGGTNANILNFNSNNVLNPTANYSRYYGYSVRPVTTEAAAPTPPLPAGALSGVFSVSADKKVHFSQGNLVATIDASGAPTAWKFAANQYDYLGEGGANKTIGATAGDVDLFGWSTSTNGGTSTTDNYGIKTSTKASDYSGDFYDWGKAVGDGNTWRTLSKDEWTYLFDTRTVNNGTKEGKSYQRATINSDATSVYGMILYPDNYTSQTGATSYTSTEWTTMKENGCVFLPAAGYRYQSDVSEVGVLGSYWSSTAGDSNDVYRVYFDSYDANPGYEGTRCDCYSVRLVTESK